MKNLLPLLALTTAALLITGCQSVPATKLKFGSVALESPKEITISNLVTTFPDGTQLQLQGYQSHNSVDVLSAVASANAQSLAQLIELIKSAKGGASPLLLP